MDELPVQAGSYALILELPQNQTLNVGRLGRCAFPAGFYVYLGSARGPGGIRARLGRHLRGAEKTWWHIDYLRKASEVRGYGYLVADNGLQLECNWAKKLADHPTASIVVPKFGASDCQMGCQAHLVYFPQSDMPLITGILATLNPAIRLLI
jgi:Uri superfamily endonuclease